MHKSFVCCELPAEIEKKLKTLNGAAHLATNRVVRGSYFCLLSDEKRSKIIIKLMNRMALQCVRVLDSLRANGEYHQSKAFTICFGFWTSHTKLLFVDSFEFPRKVFNVDT